MMAEPAQGRRYLVGIQGLRTVAALLVAVYHIWFGRVSGGVDVFFVVAGFFAIGSLTRAFERASDWKGMLRAGWTYLVRTLRRIVPSAAVVVLVTVVASYFWMPTAYWSDNIGDARASLLFFENWRLIERSTDYLQQDLSASPFQQFWALGVNAQFYLMIAVVLTAVAAFSNLMRSSERKRRTTLFVVLGLVLIASFAFSVIYTAKAQPAAYFNTFARLWEFMIGAFAALLIRREIGSRRLAAVLGWVGLAVLLALGAFFDLSRMLPGALSLAPVLAAVLIIVSSWNRAEPVVLKWKPILWVADASFAFYLWHWPLLVFYRWHFGYEVSLAAGLGIIVVSLVLAVVTTKLIEDPIRKNKMLNTSWWRSLLVCGLLMVPPGAAIAYWTHLVDSRETPISEASPPGGLNQNAVAGVATTAADLVPNPAVARHDVVAAYGMGCHQNATDAEVVTCEWGDPEAEDLVALVGGSHSLQWLDAVSEHGKENGYRVVSMTKSGCLFGDARGIAVEQDPSCTEWNDTLISGLLELHPDLVITIATRSVEGVETVPQGYTDRFEQLLTASVPILAIRDNPAFDFDPPVCVERDSFEECSIAAEDWYSPISTLEFPDDPSFVMIDIEPTLCPAGTCSSVQGNVLVYRDWNHLTRTWTMENSSVVTDAVARILRSQ